jgi:hypothetical protein
MGLEGPVCHNLFHRSILSDFLLVPVWLNDDIGPDVPFPVFL